MMQTDEIVDIFALVLSFRFHFSFLKYSYRGQVHLNKLMTNVSFEPVFVILKIQ